MNCFKQPHLIKAKASLYPILCEDLYFQIETEVKMSRYYVAYLIAKMGLGKVEEIIEDGVFFYIKMKEWWKTSTNLQFQQILLKNDKYYIYDKNKILTFSRITTIEHNEIIYDTTHKQKILSQVKCIGDTWIKVIQGVDEDVIIQYPYFSKHPSHPFYSLKCVLFPYKIVRCPYSFHPNPKIPEDDEIYSDVYLFVSLFQYKYKYIKPITSKANEDQRDFVVEEYFINKEDEQLINEEKIKL